MQTLRGKEEKKQGEEMMEPAIWGRLPDELIDRILALLPLPTILTLRPTCRRFHSLLFSPSFISLLRPADAAASPTAASLLLSHPQFANASLHLYSSAADAWRRAPLSPPSPRSHLLSSSGLLLFRRPASTRRPAALLVSNLLTKSSRLLRPPTHSFSGAATLVCLPSPWPHGYRIFLPCSSSDRVFVYDSKTRAWSGFPAFPPALGMADSHQEGALFDGSLYFATPEPFSVVGFDLGAGTWAALAAPGFPAELAFARLVGTAAGDRLYLVGGVGSAGISRSLRVWELVGRAPGEGKAGAWEEVGRLPDVMCRKFVSVCYHNYSHVYCLWHEGLVCVCCTTWPEVLFFRVARGTWHWLPRCPMLPEKSSCGFRWFSFVPDLYALV